MTNKKKKARKQAALQARIAAATPIESLRSPGGGNSFETIGTIPDVPTNEIVFKNRKGKYSFISGSELAQFQKEQPGRVFEGYTNALWADSTGTPESRFGQQEKNLLAEGEPSVAQRGLNRSLAAARAGKAANIAQGVMQRQVRATGIKQDQRELESMQRQMGISRVLNRVDAQNMADRAMDERRDLVRDYSFDAEALSQNAAAGGLGAAAEAEMERKIAKRQRGAAGAARNAGIAGQAAGLVLGAISAFSSAELKENIEPAPSILAGLAQVDLKKWNYIGESEAHIGPIAEDFQRIFGVGDGKTLKLVDVMGVMIGAVKEMAAAVQRNA